MTFSRSKCNFLNLVSTVKYYNLLHCIGVEAERCIFQNLEKLDLHGCIPLELGEKKCSCNLGELTI